MKNIQLQTIKKIGTSLFSVLLSISVLISCKSDEESIRIFEAAFEGSTTGLAEVNNSTTVTVQFSTPTITETTIVVEIEENGVTYGQEYETSPAASNNLVSITIPSGSEQASFTVTRLVEFIDEGYGLSFSIVSIDGEEEPQIVGTNSFTLTFQEVLNTGSVINLETGGPTQPNQVYIDLSSGIQTAVRRDTWELGFYNGSENRVFLNASLKVSAAAITGFTDLNTVNSSTELKSTLSLSSYGSPVEVSTVSELLKGLPVGYTQYGNEEDGLIFTDQKTGNLDETAIAAISTNASENYVYIVSLGDSIPDVEVEAGSINTALGHRGFMKIRVLSDNNTYTIQYADLDATTFEEVTITKDGSTNLTAFSLTAGKTVDVEPASWDINFSGVFSFFGNAGFGAAAGVTYSDYGLHNTLGGVGLYLVTNDHTSGEESIEGSSDITYESFSISDVDEDQFAYDDRTVIGSAWRSTSALAAYDYMYYIIKDVTGNYYKLQFTGLVSATNERGYSQLKYELLD